MSKSKKYEYTLKMLEKRLFEEEDDLSLWNEIMETNPTKQAEHNIPSTEFRINELKEVIDMIKTSEE